MSYSSDSLGKYEAVRGKGELARMVAAVDPQRNPANILVLRALARAAELGDDPEEKISEAVTRVLDAVVSQEGSVDLHSYSHEDGLCLGGAVLSFLPGWRLNVDLHAPEDEWPVTSRESVERIDVMLYPLAEHETDAAPFLGQVPFVNDVLCNLAPTVVFTRNIWSRWAYDPLNSSLELQTQAEILDYVIGLDEGITASQ